MLTGLARKELNVILKRSNLKDLKIIELKLVPGIPRSDITREEMIDDILSNVDQPSQILRQQRLRKKVLLRYLRDLGLPVSSRQPKCQYIKIFLEIWQIMDDDYLWKYLTPEQIEAGINRFEEEMKESLGKLKHRISERLPQPNELKNLKSAMDKILRTIDSIGNASTLPSSSSSTEIPRREESSPSSSDDADDSSSSVSSVEVIEQPPHILALAQLLQVQSSKTKKNPSRGATSELSEQPSSSDIFEPALFQQPNSESSLQCSSSELLSPMGIRSPWLFQEHSTIIPEPSSPQLKFSMDLSEPSSAALHDIPSPSSSQEHSILPEPSSLQLQFSKGLFEPSTSAPPADVQVNNASTSRRVDQPASASSPSKRNAQLTSPRTTPKRVSKHRTVSADSPDYLVQKVMSPYYKAVGSHRNKYPAQFKLRTDSK